MLFKNPFSTPSPQPVAIALAAATIAALMLTNHLHHFDVGVPVDSGQSKNLPVAREKGSCWLPATEADWHEWYAYNYCKSSTVPSNTDYSGVNVDAYGKELHDWLQ
jgi:hypothetical protein